MSERRRDRGAAARRRPARRGALWYVAEHRLRTMRSWTWTAARSIASVGNPILYLFALGVGLALVERERRRDGVEGVSYLAFVAPALLASAAVTVARRSSASR